MPSVLKVIEIKDSDVSYSVEVFDAKKAAWEKLPSNGARSYTLKDFDPSEVYKFRLSITIAPADDLKVYTILSEEYHHKFEAGMLEAKEPQDVTIKKHLCQKQDAPVKAEPQKVKRGKEYEDISYLTNGPNVYDGLLRSGPNYSVQSNGTLYVKSGSDGWNGHGLCNKPISNKCTTMWYVHVVRTSVSWCVIGLLAEDYKRSSSNSMWGLSFHNSSIVSGSPDSIKNIRPFSNRHVLRNGAVACFKADLVAQKLSVSFSEDFNNYYTIADNLPRDRPLVPFVMAFNQGDTIEFLNDASKASNEREERRFPSFLRRSGSSRSKEIEEYLVSLSKSPRELSKLFDVFENSPENDNENRSENENGSDGENENAGNESDDGDRNEPQRKAPPDEKSEKGAQCKIQ